MVCHKDENQGKRKRLSRCKIDAQELLVAAMWFEAKKKQLIRCFEGGPQFPQSHPDGQSVSEVSGQCQSGSEKFAISAQLQEEEEG